MGNGRNLGVKHSSKDVVFRELVKYVDIASPEYIETAIPEQYMDRMRDFVSVRNSQFDAASIKFRC